MVDPRYGGLMRSDFATQDSTITLTLRLHMQYYRLIGLYRPWLVSAYTEGEVTSPNLWSRYDRHVLGIT